VTGVGAGGPQSPAIATFTNPSGVRISSPLFSRREIEAAILRARPAAFASGKEPSKTKDPKDGGEPSVDGEEQAGQEGTRPVADGEPK
jgi:hypothetical protein